MDMDLVGSVIDEGFNSNEHFDRSQSSNPFLSGSTQALSPAQRGQLWGSPLPPNALHALAPSAEVVSAVEVFFPGEAALVLRRALSPPDTPLRASSCWHSSAQIVQDLSPAICGNCEEAPATLECRDCLLDLPSDEAHFCEACFAVHIATKQFKHHQAQPCMPPKQQAHPIVGHMHALISHMEALTSSETALLAHLRKLSLVLRQLSYVTIPSVRVFAQSAACVGFRVTVDNLAVISEMFLHALQEIRLPQFRKKLVAIELSSIDSLLAQCTSMQTVFTMAIQKFQPTFMAYSHIVRLFEPLSAQLSAQIVACPDFGEHMLSVEGSSGSLLSLLTKPLARIPAYILICKDIYVTVLTIVSVVDEEYCEVLQYTQRLAKKLHADMLEVLVHCYDEAREEQNKRLLHDLHDQCIRGHSRMSVAGLVAVGRGFIRTGQVKMHLKLGRFGKVRPLTLHLLSDCLLGAYTVYEPRPPPLPKIKKSVSFENGALKKSVMDAFEAARLEEAAASAVVVPVEYDLVPGALLLNFCIPLTRRSGTECFPLPSCLSNTESSWFVVIGAQKSVYLCADSVADRDQWVREIQQVLRANTADSDIFRVMNQRSLVNTLLSEINTRAGERLTAAALVGPLPANWSDVCTQNISCLQPNWWGLFEVLEGIVRATAAALEGGDEGGGGSGGGTAGAASQDTADPTAPIAHLRHVIDLHTQELTETLLSLCASAAGRADITSALAAGTSNPAAEHLIAVDWFFQRADAAMVDKQQQQQLLQSATSGEAASQAPRRWGGNSDTRPVPLLLFVMSNVLLGVRVVPNTSDERAQHWSVEYSFHIELKHLECVHHCDVAAGPAQTQSQTQSTSVSSPGAHSPAKSSRPHSSREGGPLPSSSSSSSPSSSAAILLRDTSISAKLLSLLGTSNPSERVVYAPNIASKTRWLSFLGTCISTYKLYDCGAADGAESQRARMLRRALPTLRRVATKTTPPAARSSDGIWCTESNDNA